MMGFGQSMVSIGGDHGYKKFRNYRSIKLNEDDFSGETRRSDTPVSQCEKYSPPAPFSRDVTIDQVIAGRFRILSLLGKGGMGSVFLVKDSSSGNNYALKTIAANNASISAVKRFHLEARATLDLRDNPITDRGVEELSKSTTVKSLALEGKKVTTKSISNFGKFPSLENLTLSGDGWSASEKEKLSKIMNPKHCRVIFSESKSTSIQSD